MFHFVTIPQTGAPLVNLLVDEWDEEKGTTIMYTTYVLLANLYLTICGLAFMPRALQTTVQEENLNH